MILVLDEKTQGRQRVKKNGVTQLASARRLAEYRNPLRRASEKVGRTKPCWTFVAGVQFAADLEKARSATNVDSNHILGQLLRERRRKTSADDVHHAAPRASMTTMEGWRCCTAV